MGFITPTILTLMFRLFGGDTLLLDVFFMFKYFRSYVCMDILWLVLYLF